MKTAIVLVLSLVLVGSAFATGNNEKIDPGPQQPTILQTLDCAGASLVTCGQGDSSPDPGPGGNVDIYGCTGLSYGDCGEVVYEVCIASTGNLTVNMTYNHVTGENDLDLFLLGSCDEDDCLDASTGVSGEETVEGAALPAGTYYLVVDGWAGRCDGAAVHDIEVICDSPCVVSSEAKTWSEIKGRFGE